MADDSADAVHLLPHDGGWGVRADSASDPEMMFPNRQDAVEAARAMARTAGVPLLYHAPSGAVVHQEHFDD